MAFLINEQQMVEDNIFKYEKRASSEYSRFLDKSPIFVTYYHINVNETTVDDGFRDVESIIGNRSPLRFQKIENFPMYGLDPVILSITDSEQGLDTNFESECIILPNTIKPLQNDFFMINHVHGSFLFRVTEIQYDTIRPDNFYKIDYKFEYLDDARVDAINEQVEEKFTCVLQNIGSENSCIIKEEFYETIQNIDAMYDDMISTYMALFYSERYNCFIYEDGEGNKLYDPFQVTFFNNHKLLNKKNDYKVIILSDEVTDPKKRLKYEKSIYRFFEKCELKMISKFEYGRIPAMNKQETSFCRWYDKSVSIVDIPTLPNIKSDNSILSDEVVDLLIYNMPTDNKYFELMQNFIRGRLTIGTIPLTLNEELMKLNANEEVFFITPILLYIVNKTVNDFLKEKK